MSEKSKIWLCMDCGKRYVRPRRLRATGGLIDGECWACKGKMHHAILPIADSAFAGESFVHTLLRKAKAPEPKDWSPRGKEGIPRPTRKRFLEGE